MLPACEENDAPLAGVGGFSLHAGVSIKARERLKLEKLCRYITRLSLSEKRLQQTADGQTLRTENTVQGRNDASDL